jgi:formate hydrogenlyase subunit 3/multisubunit Na+/H+ antiporter MnhD subunit
MFYRVAPLSAGFMLTSIVGFLLTVFYIYPSIESRFPDSQWSASLAFALVLFFILMFIASIISMSLAPIDAEFDVKHKKSKR